jgi:hypothetical protein
METIKEDDLVEDILLDVYLAATKKSYQLSPVLQIQRSWRSYWVQTPLLLKLFFVYDSDSSRCPSSSDLPQVLITVESSFLALLLQDKLTFSRIRNLIHTYEQEDPKSILLRINRNEVAFL